MSTDRVVSAIAGVFLGRLAAHVDNRGSFVKLFQRSAAIQLGVLAEVAECYVARSDRGVLRGFHYQVEPCSHAKYVSCLDGEILDVTVDITPSSTSYGNIATFTLSGTKSEFVYVPPGVAHGYQVLSDSALVVNLATGEYCPEHERGIRWDSVSAWPLPPRALSPKDAGWPLFRP